MTAIRLAAAALNLTPLAWEENRQCITAALQAARKDDVGILCLPEMAITGYGCEDMFLAPEVPHTALQILHELLPDSQGLVTALGLPLRHENQLYNAVAMLCDGQLLGFVCKQHLAGDGIHYEPRWFCPWPCGVVGSLEWDGARYPVGDLLFDCGGVRIGFEICRDAWVDDRPASRLAARGAHVILNPSASHFAFDKQRIREQLAVSASGKFDVSVAYANLLGNEAGRAIYDGGTLLASSGEIIARGPRFSFADVLLTSTTIHTASSARHESAAQPDTLIGCPFRYPPVDPDQSTSQQALVLIPGQSAQTANVPGHPAWESGTSVKQEEFARAVPLALWDYLRKSGSQGFVVSLSGGADSATVAVMVHLMTQLASCELSNFLLQHKLPAMNGLTTLADANPATTARDLVRQLLACVYQATENSSQVTADAARTVAEAINAEFMQWDIDQIVGDYVRTISTTIGRPLTWERDDLALQNIQARARGPGIWLLANLRSALLLATSNRSEAAVGYATMDGDTCGGLAPIAGIDKAFLRDWLRWMETTGPAGIGPLADLAVVNRQQPTAELRPAAAAQTDESDLMPYRVLDAIERAAIRDKMMPLAVLHNVAPRFSDYTKSQLATWIERFFQLWCRNQWKRERYAPSFHLDDENLDPKTWCRFPILSGGFERELQALREHVGRAAK